MSIEVQRDRLAETARRYAFAYLLTVGDDRRAHVVAVSPVVDDGRVLVAEPGRRSLHNVAAGAPATLVWPPAEPGGYSLIVDGDAGAYGEVLVVAPTRAVLHRPAPPASDAAGRCASDCLELPVR